MVRLYGGITMNYGISKRFTKNIALIIVLISGLSFASTEASTWNSMTTSLSSGLETGWYNTKRILSYHPTLLFGKYLANKAANFRANNDTKRILTICKQTLLLTEFATKEIPSSRKKLKEVYATGDIQTIIPVLKEVLTELNLNIDLSTSHVGLIQSLMPKIN